MTYLVTGSLIIHALISLQHLCNVLNEAWNTDDSKSDKYFPLQIIRLSDIATLKKKLWGITFDLNTQRVPVHNSYGFQTVTQPSNAEKEEEEEGIAMGNPSTNGEKRVQMSTKKKSPKDGRQHLTQLLSHSHKLLYSKRNKSM